MPIEIESPEHIGYGNIDCNLAESSVTDLIFSQLYIDLKDLVLCYGHHVGNPGLRELIASEYPGISAGDVLLTPGAAAALFIVNSSLMSAEDEAIIELPNYATNIETPGFVIGATVNLVPLEMENGFRLDIDKVRKCISSKTKLISITTPHNPTGKRISPDDLNELISLTEANNCHLLVDETYRDLVFGEKYPLAATLSDRVISISSVSKAYGIPGVRIGWLICRNKKLMETFLAAKEQIFICNSVVDEEIAYRYLLKKDKHFAPIKKQVDNNFAALRNWICPHPHLEWREPEGGVVCFPRFKKSVNIDIEKFYKTLNQKYKTYVGPGHWFMMDKRYFRLGFGWENEKKFLKGMANIDKAIAESM